MKPLCVYLWAIAIVVSPVTLGGEFVNLTFDEPDLNGSLTPILPGGPFIGSTGDLLKGWTATANGSPIRSMSYVPYRTPDLGSEVLLMENAPGSVGGRFRLVLDSKPRPPGPEIRISQRGTIPANAVGLRVYNTATVSGYVNGEFIGSIVDRANLTWDVRSFAGQDVELSIVLPSNKSGSFDIFGFEMIPEPSTTALLVVGGLCLGWMIVSKRRSRPSGK